MDLARSCDLVIRLCHILFKDLHSSNGGLSWGKLLSKDLVIRFLRIPGREIGTGEHLNIFVVVVQFLVNKADIFT